VGGFSKGMRQKVAIARALVAEAPGRLPGRADLGVDPEASANVRGIVEELSAQGRTLVLCTHNLDEAARLCRRVAVVKGRVLALGPPRELARSAPSVAVEVEGEAAPLAQALSASGLSATAHGPHLFVGLARESDVPDLVARLIALGARIRRVEPRGQLEEIYLQLVSPG
jgi:ABC-2 type transport system ATP-binding protein